MSKGICAQNIQLVKGPGQTTSQSTQASGQSQSSRLEIEKGLINIRKFEGELV
jgi:hypothetical protein